MAGIPTIGQGSVRPGPAIASGVVKMVDSVADQRQWHLLRSSVNFVNGQLGPVQFFAERSNNALEGNLESESILPAPQWIEVAGISIHYTPGDGVAGGVQVTHLDAAEILTRCYLNVSINQQLIIDRWPLIYVPPGGGPNPTTDTAVATVNGPMGVPSPNAIYWLPISFVLKGQESTRIEILTQQALVLTAAVRVHMTMHGERYMRSQSQ